MNARSTHTSTGCATVFPTARILRSSPCADLGIRRWKRLIRKKHSALWLHFSALVFATNFAVFTACTLGFYILFRCGLLSVNPFGRHVPILLLALVSLLLGSISPPERQFVRKSHRRAVYAHVPLPRLLPLQMCGFVLYYPQYRYALRGSIAYDKQPAKNRRKIRRGYSPL